MQEMYNGFMNKDRYRVLLLAISIGCLLLAIVLSIRLYHQVKGSPPPIPKQTNISYIQPWMTVPHIAHVYKIPPEVLFQQLHLDKVQYRNKNISEIAKSLKKDPQDLIKQIQQIIINYQETHSPLPTLNPHEPNK